MPKECLHCGFVDVDDAAGSCQRCASERMRYSVLAGLRMKQTQGDKLKTVRLRPASEWPERLRRAALFLVCAQASFAALLAALVFTLPEETLPKRLAPLALVEAFALEQPAQARAAALALPALATVAATVFALRGMFLAQQAAGLLAPIAAAGLAVEAGFLGLPMPPAFPGLAAAAGALLSFLAGLRIGKHKRWADEPAADAIEYKAIDAWDRSARPNQKIAPIPLGRRSVRLKWGIVATAIVGPILWGVFRVAAGGNFSVYGSTLALSRLCLLEFLVGFAGGVIAGSGSRNGFSQGVLCGAGAAGARVGLGWLSTGKLPSLFYAGKLGLTWKLAHTTGLLMIPGAVLGGIFGRYALPANMIVRGKHVEKADEVVYVGDRLPAETVERV